MPHGRRTGFVASRPAAPRAAPQEGIPVAPPSACPDACRRRRGLALIDATVREAELTADLVIGFLGSMAGHPACPWRAGKSDGLTAEFLLELGAVLRLALWQRAGLRETLAPGLPTAREALTDLFARHGLAPGGPAAVGAASPLAGRVTRIALSRLAWPAREELDADVVLGVPDDETLLEALADLLWTARGRG